MPENAPSSLARSASARRQDLGWAALLFVLTAVVFWPAGRWLASQAFAREQLKQSVFIVALAGIWIAWEKRRALKLDLQLSNTTLWWLGISYLLAFAALGLKNPLIFLAGLIAAAGGAVNYTFGRQAFQRTLPLLSVFALVILCVLLFPILDWPLRQMAGVEAARLLRAFGFATELTVSTEKPDVSLMLKLGQQTFVVATECNGFGLITSNLLLGLIRLLYQRAAWPWFVVLLPLCVASAFVFNFLRIAIIVLLAPRFPNNYHAMHETVGIVALYSGLGAVWWITGTSRKRHSRIPA